MYSLKFASISKRMVAFGIDVLLILLVTFFLSFLLKPFFLLFGSLDGSDFFDEHVWIIRLILAFCISFFYFCFFQSSSISSSLGQLFCKIKIVDAYENTITFLRAIGRFFAFFLSVITLGFGFLMAFYTQNRQTLHDKICKTYVIDR